MIRAAVATTIRSNCGVLTSRSISKSTNRFLIRRDGKSWTALPFHSSRKIIGYRFLSSGNAKESANEKGKAEKNGEEETQIVLTPGQKVVAASRLTMWAGIFAFASVCAYYIGKELVPTKMSPNVVFNKALEIVRENPEVTRRLGTPLKGYGRDHGGKREGRRNFIEHTEYTNEEDGSKRTRVRFNLEGPNGKGFCFAEVSKAMPAGEFVYVLVQDKLNGQVTNVVDNRAAMAVAKMAGDNAEGAKVFNQLLTGGADSSRK